MAEYTITIVKGIIKTLTEVINRKYPNNELTFYYVKAVRGFNLEIHDKQGIIITHYFNTLNEYAVWLKGYINGLCFEKDFNRWLK